MITFDTYRQAFNNPNNLSEIRRTQADEIMNLTFTNDVGYKRVYVLTLDGWQWLDAKYSKHSSTTITGDAVDYYLQLRPHVKIPLGTYVFVPDDDSPNIGFAEESPENPFIDSGFNINKLWLVVNRTDDNQFVRYLILKCNWNFKWVAHIKQTNAILNCYGCARYANSYSSGIYTDSIMTQLDQIIAAWLPDTNFVFKDKCDEFGLADTRYINRNMRFMVSNNDIVPNVFMVSKIIDTAPQGVLKLTFEQVELDPKRDNIELQVCDYYNNSGDIQIEIPDDAPVVPSKTSTIKWMVVNEDGELVEATLDSQKILNIGKISYFTAEFSDPNVDGQWIIKLVDDDNIITEAERNSLEKLMVITKFDDTTISLKPGKSNKLKGQKFELSVSDSSGEYKSKIDVEVSV